MGTIEAIINLVFCLAIFAMAFARVRVMSKETKVLVRWSYSILGASALWFGLTPFVGSWYPALHFSGTVFSGAQCFCMAAMSGIWSKGPPGETWRNDPNSMLDRVFRYLVTHWR